MWLHLHFQFTYFPCIYSEESIAKLSSEESFEFSLENLILHLAPVKNIHKNPRNIGI